MKDISKAKRIISDDGIEIYYWIRHITGSKQPTRILHSGSSMNHSAMEKLEQELNARNYSTVIFDQRGTGYSKTPNRKEFFQLDKYTQDLDKIIFSESIEKPILIGHSAGFMPSVEYMLKTNNVSKLIGICGSYHFPDTTINKTLFLVFNHILRYNEWIGSIATGAIHRLKNESRDYNDHSQFEKKSAFQNYINIIDVPLNEANNHIISGKEINKWNITPQLRKLGENMQGRMLLIYGKRDSAVISSTGQSIQNMISTKCDIIEIEDASHSIPMTHYKQVAEIMEKYK